MELLLNLYRYRHYIWQSAWNDFRYRYAGTGLGVFWNIINPLLQVLLYTVVFSRLLVIRGGASTEAPFALYLCTGLFPWLAFSETIIQGSNAFFDNATYLKRLALPPDIFVAKEVVRNTFNLGVALFLVAALSLLLGQPAGWSWLWLPAIGALLQGIGLGVALGLAGLRVLFPDIGEVLRVLMQLWTWTMPIIYPAALVPAAAQPWLKFNPPYLFIASIRQIYLAGQEPAWSDWLIMLAWSGLFIGLGGLILHQLRHEIRDNV
jgi:ABC-type polysaccharide/polyol phosphate export permease